MNTRYSFNEIPLPEFSREQSRFQSGISNFGEDYGKNLNLPKKFILDLVEQENGQEKDKPKKEYLFEQNIENKNNEKGKFIILKNNIIINNNNNFDYNDSCKIERNSNLNLNTTNNMGTKFFIF